MIFVEKFSTTRLNYFSKKKCHEYYFDNIKISQIQHVKFEGFVINLIEKSHVDVALLADSFLYDLIFIIEIK